MPITTAVFDAYGTLFDVAGAARRAASEPTGGGLTDIWPRLAEEWRRKQLEYTWLRAITGEHRDFAGVTADALDWAMDAAGLADPVLRARLLALYDTLPAYPEVAEMLVAVRAQGITTAILSNGTPAMLDAATQSAGIGALLDAVLSVEQVGVFKPARAVYDLVGTRFGTDPSEVLFVSSNGWDAAGAAGYGFTVAWINRMGLPADRLSHRPHHSLPDLRGIQALLAGLPS